MSTPAVTILKNRVLDWETNEKKDVTVAKFYRHWDGYPTGHGADIAMALLNASLTERKKYIRFVVMCAKLYCIYRVWVS